jgi:hypothetical protein
MARFSIRALFALTLFVAALSGCSQEGTLVIENDAATDFTGTVDGTQVTIDPGARYETSVYIGKSSGIVGPDKINVIISGSATTKRAFTDEIDITSDETTTYVIQDDAAAIVFTNLYIKAVNEIAIRACGGTDFGPNLLPSKQTVPPGATVTLQIDSGCWDIQVNYDRDEILEVIDTVQVDIGQIVEIEWEPGYVYPPPVPPVPPAR